MSISARSAALYSPTYILPSRPNENLTVRFLIAFVLLCNTACARQAEVARRDYILGSDHGWIDLVLGPSTKGEQCGAVLSVNGEQMLVIPEPAAAAGYRIPVSVGRLDLECFQGQYGGAGQQRARLT